MLGPSLRCPCETCPCCSLPAFPPLTGFAHPTHTPNVLLMLMTATNVIRLVGGNCTHVKNRHQRRSGTWTMRKDFQRAACARGHRWVPLSLSLSQAPALLRNSTARLAVLSMLTCARNIADIADIADAVHSAFQGPYLHPDHLPRRWRAEWGRGVHGQTSSGQDVRGRVCRFGLQYGYTDPRYVLRSLSSGPHSGPRCVSHLLGTCSCPPRAFLPALCLFPR